MSGGLAPSLSTVYVGNLPFSLTTNDLHKIFEKYGKVVKVTVLKDRITRKSKGVAFIFFLKKEDAQTCARTLNETQMFGRTIKCSIAKDNGRSAEFIRRRTYPDKSFCYECGEEGHLSYQCEKNALGDRPRPPKKERKPKKNAPKEKPTIDYASSDDEWQYSRPARQSIKKDEEEDEEEEAEPDLETLSEAIRLESEAAEKRHSSGESSYAPPRKKIRQSSYFSDEEDTSD